MIDFCIIGSGVAGSTISKILSKKYSVLVLDKARGPGGRSSNKRFQKNLSFDHGVQYISPKSKSFKKFLESLRRKNIIKIWNGEHLDLTFEKKEFNKKYIGRLGNNDICKYNLKNINQSYESTVKSIKFNKFFWEIKLNNEKYLQSKSIILTCPFPQLKKLAFKFLNKKIFNLKINMHPNITTMLAFKNKKEIPVSSIKFKDDLLGWAANENSKKRFKSTLSLWTLQSTVKWAKKTINNYKKNRKVENAMISKFLSYTGFKKSTIIFKKTHGWKYSYNYQQTLMKSYWDKNKRIGVCADWFIGPKVESAWLSANDLAKKIKKI